MNTSTEGRKRVGKGERTFAPTKINVKRITAKNHEYIQRWLYIPSRLVESGKFPFSDNEQVLLVIEGNRVIIEKLRPSD
jgi:hypothetical protein